MRTAHGVSEVLSAQPDPGAGRVRARVVLACGCLTDLDVPLDRLIPAGSSSLIVGKYPCPRHPRWPAKTAEPGAGPA